MKHEYMIMTPKLDNHHSVKRLPHLHNPRKCTKFDARQRWCLSLFWTMPNRKAVFLFTSTKRSLWCSSPSVNQGTAVITNSSWQHTRTLGPNCAVAFRQASHSIDTSNLYSQDMMPCDFFLFRQIKNTLKSKHLKMWKQLNLRWPNF